MIPPVIHEQDCHSFKFWFNDEIQDGMIYRNELFYRLHSVAEHQRARLYQQACQLAQQDLAQPNTVIVTSSGQVCSIWLSLRSTSLHETKPSQLIKGEDNPELLQF